MDPNATPAIPQQQEPLPQPQMSKCECFTGSRNGTDRPMKDVPTYLHLSLYLKRDVLSVRLMIVDY